MNVLFTYLCTRNSPPVYSSVMSSDRKARHGGLESSAWAVHGPRTQTFQSFDTSQVCKHTCKSKDDKLYFMLNLIPLIKVIMYQIHS